MKTYTIKEFSKKSGITIRTLRYYDSLGLINMEENKQGVKTLKESDFLTLETIRLLKISMMPLNQIKEILASHNLKEQLVLQENILRKEILEKQVMLEKIELIQKSNLSEEELIKSYHQSLEMKRYAHQFSDSNRLALRINFHKRYSKFTESWQNWLFSHYKLKPGMKVLEIGCGTGDLWVENEVKDVDLTLLDKSSKMLESTKNKLTIPAKYIEADMVKLPFDDNSFDCVICNHALMYASDVNQAMSEIKRVVKDNGNVYISCWSKDNLREMDELLDQLDPNIHARDKKIDKEFCLENGQEKLLKYFSNIKMDERKEIYLVDDEEELVNYIMSMVWILDIESNLFYRQDELVQAIRKIMKVNNGYFPITLNSGTFMIEGDN